MNDQTNLLKLGIRGAWINIAGILLSGPLGLLIVTLVHPSPAWQSARVWAENYHPVQTLPFFFGFLLLGGYLVMLAVAHQLAEPRHKAHTTIALLLTAAFAALIFFNYINQTTFLPALARDYRPEYDTLITAFSFANPRSLCWAIEMWGYALLGVATLFAAPVFQRSRTERITASLMIANGVISVLGAFAAALDMSWLLDPPGLLFYVIWNSLVLVMAVFYLLSLRRRLAETRFAPGYQPRPIPA